MQWQQKQQTGHRLRATSPARKFGKTRRFNSIKHHCRKLDESRCRLTAIAFQVGARRHRIVV